MSRLTRGESQELTKARLIDAATKLFLEYGFHATSLEAIGEEAGYSRGAVYSNFSSKADIAQTVVATLYTQEVTKAKNALEASAAGGPTAWASALAASLDKTLGRADWIKLEFELGAVVLGPEAKAITAGRWSGLRKTTTDVISELCNHSGIAVPENIELLGDGIVAALLGTSIQRLHDATLTSNSIEPIFQMLMSAAFPTALPPK